MRTASVVLALAFAVQLQAQYGETITVSRKLVDVRVTRTDGEPIRDLAPKDFDVRIGGDRATVESVTWIDEEQIVELEAVDSVESLIEREDEEEAPRGRLFVLFVQTDFARNNARVAGHMNFSRYAEELIESLQPSDRVAVFSFDSHLKFRRDFTSDKDDVRAALHESLRIDHPGPPPRVANPSLASRLDRDEMKNAATSERALLLVANALIPISGPKTLLLLGWGLGSRQSGMSSDWTSAQRALDKARASIFAFDTTIADYHDLELGLQTAAKETGGFYTKTHVFPEVGLQRLQRTLRGHYELELRMPESRASGTHDLDVRVKRRGAIVLAPASVTQQ